MADVVKYVGLSTVRRITKQAWEKAGIKGQDTVTWDKSNGYSVPVEKLTDNALQKLSEDKGFVMPKSSSEQSPTTGRKSNGS